MRSEPADSEAVPAVCHHLANVRTLGWRRWRSAAACTMAPLASGELPRIQPTPCDGGEPPTLPRNLRAQRAVSVDNSVTACHGSCAGQNATDEVRNHEQWSLDAYLPVRPIERGRLPG